MAGVNCVNFVISRNDRPEGSLKAAAPHEHEWNIAHVLHRTDLDLYLYNFTGTAKNEKKIL